MDYEISRRDVIMPGGVQLTMEAERHVALGPPTTMLSVACGNGELGLYLAEKYKCHMVGIDSDAGFIRAARQKTAARTLGDRAWFLIGDGNALSFGDTSFDAIFCSGALCAFFDKGLRAFRRVLKPGGVAIVTDVVWRRGDVPQRVAEGWTGGSADIMTVEGNSAAFGERGFGVLFARAYHEPSWWDNRRCVYKRLSPNAPINPRADSLAALSRNGPV